jgi:hypothetical protein
MLLDLMPDNVSQGEFDFDAPETRDRGKLMAAMDAINDRFGRGAIHVGSAVGAGSHATGRCGKKDLRLNTPPNLATCLWPEPDVANTPHICPVYRAQQGDWPELAGTSHRRSCKKRSSLPAVDATMSCTPHIHKKIDRHPLAFQV